MKKLLQTNKGFTLIEILLVVAAIAILAGIVILAINPAKQLGDTRNAQRRSDVTTILNAVHQYAIDNNGNFPSGIDTITGASQILGTATVGCDTSCTATTTVASCVDLSSALVPTYIVSIPHDPTLGTSTITHYYINKRSDGRITVGACEPEQGAIMSVSR